jgi:hypothetical protein
MRFSGVSPEAGARWGGRRPYPDLAGGKSEEERPVADHRH